MPAAGKANRWAAPSAKKEGEMDFEKIVREAVAEWSYSGRMGSAKGLELLISDLTARLESAQQGFAADETNRLRDLLWIGVLCGACGHSYKYNRADDAKGEKGHEEHLLAYPDCPSSRR